MLSRSSKLTLATLATGLLTLTGCATPANPVASTAPPSATPLSQSEKLAKESPAVLRAKLIHNMESLTSYVMTVTSVSDGSSYKVKVYKPGDCLLIKMNPAGSVMKVRLTPTEALLRGNSSFWLDRVGGSSERASLVQQELAGRWLATGTTSWVSLSHLCSGAFFASFSSKLPGVGATAELTNRGEEELLMLNDKVQGITAVAEATSTPRLLSYSTPTADYTFGDFNNVPASAIPPEKMISRKPLLK